MSGSPVQDRPVHSIVGHLGPSTGCRVTVFMRSAQGHRRYMTDATPPLIATADEQLRDQAQRWCAALGATPDLASDLTEVRRAWRQASGVIVGEDLIGSAAEAGLVRRDHVLVIAREPSQWWSAAIALGAQAVCSPADDRAILDLLATALDGRDEACVVSVIGGSGGAGASTLAASLAVEAQRRGLRALAWDADPGGGGLDLLLGAERCDGLRWHDFAATRGRIDTGSLVEVLPQQRGVSVLSWTRDERGPLPGSWPGVFSSAARGFDLVVVDLPRYLDEAAVGLVGRSVLTIVVVPEEIGAASAARRVVASVARSAPAVALVSAARRSGIGPDAVSDAVGLPVLARLRRDRHLRGAIDRGYGPARSRPLRRTADTVLDALGLSRS